MPMSRDERRERFQKVKELLDAGLTPPQIVRAGLVDLSTGTMYNYKKFETYDAFCEAQKKRVKKYKKKDKKEKPTKKKVKETSDDTWFEDTLTVLKSIDSRLEKVEKRLDEKIGVKLL